MTASPPPGPSLQAEPVAKTEPSVWALPVRPLRSIAPAITKTSAPLTPPSATASPLPMDVGSLTAQGTFDFEGLLLARPERIERREGLPGQPHVVLEDALRSDRWVWLRFRVQDGARGGVERVAWEHGVIGSFRAQAAGPDLRLVIQLPRALVTKRTRVDLRLRPGGSYRFRVDAPWLSTFIRDMF